MYLEEAGDIMRLSISRIDTLWIEKYYSKILDKIVGKISLEVIEKIVDYLRIREFKLAFYSFFSFKTVSDIDGHKIIKFPLNKIIIDADVMVLMSSSI